MNKGNAAPKRELTPRHFWMRWTMVGVFAVSVLAALGFSYFYPSSSDRDVGATESPPSRDLLVVRTGSLRSPSLPVVSSESSGVVQPRRRSRLAAKEIGRVQAVLVDVGDELSPGEVVVRLESSQVAAELRVAEASLAASREQLSELLAGPRKQEIEQARTALDEARSNRLLAESNLQRMRELGDIQAVSQQELDEAETRLQTSQAQELAATQRLDLLNEGTRNEQIEAQRSQVASLQATKEQLEVRLSETVIVAPYAGRVQTRLVDEGDVVSPSQVLMEIVEDAHLEIHVGLPQEIVKESSRLVSPYCRILLGRQGNGSFSLPVELDRVAPASDPATRTRLCVFRITSKDTPAAIGDSVRVVLEDPTQPLQSDESQVWVPSQALVAGPRGLWGIYVVEASDRQNVYTIRQRPVEILSIRNQWTQVQGAIQLGDQYVLEGVHRVVDGQRVRVERTDDN